MAETDQNGVYAASKFEVGSVLSRAYLILFKNPALFVGLTFLPLLLSALIDYPAPNSLAKSSTKLIALFFNMIINGSIVYAVYQAFLGGRASFGESVSRGAARLGSLIGVTILTSLALTGGFLLFVIPGVLLLCMWYVAVPACVLERLGPVKSLKRSAELTKEYRWQILGLAIIVFLITIVLPLILTFILNALIGPGLTARAIHGVITVVPNAFCNVSMTVIYYNLRVVKENTPIGNLAGVFD
jgi:hypothetical protein